MKLLIWTSIPTHHQAGFFNALRNSGVDLTVRYFSKVGESRKKLGWTDIETLTAGEGYVHESLDSTLDDIADWRQRVHLVPGYATGFLRGLAKKLSQEEVQWVHWSERSHGGVRWWRSYPIKRWYASLVNRNALGALAQGFLADEDFVCWGIHRRKISHLYYSIPRSRAVHEPDQACVEFLSSSRSEIIFVYVGSWENRKGTDLLANAFKKVIKKHPYAKLLVVGRDKSNGLHEALFSSKQFSERLLIRGVVPADKLNSVLASADVLIQPSRFDGWGVTLNEGAAAGLALIGSDQTGSACHLIEPGFNGFRVKAGCVDSLAEAMAAYANDPELAKIHGQNSLRVYQRFTPEENALRCITAIKTWQASRSP